MTGIEVMLWLWSIIRWYWLQELDGGRFERTDLSGDWATCEFGIANPRQQRHCWSYTRGNWKSCSFAGLKPDDEQPDLDSTRRAFEVQPYKPVSNMLAELSYLYWLGHFFPELISPLQTFHGFQGEQFRITICSHVLLAAYDMVLNGYCLVFLFGRILSQNKITGQLPAWIGSIVTLKYL
jgi:hypothetical protein